jgi:hypothetical protein
MNVHSVAGTPPTGHADQYVPRLVTAYDAEVPDPSMPWQRVAFGTSGDRGRALDKTEWHVLAISQAICQYRAHQRIEGPLFLGIDTHTWDVFGLPHGARSGAPAAGGCSRLGNTASRTSATYSLTASTGAPAT